MKQLQEYVYYSKDSADGRQSLIAGILATSLGGNLVNVHVVLDFCQVSLFTLDSMSTKFTQHGIQMTL